MRINGLLTTWYHRATGSRFLNDSFWALSGNVAGKGLALVAGIVVARLLGRDLFGEYGLIKSTLIGISILSTFGLGYTATKFVAEIRTSEP